MVSKGICVSRCFCAWSGAAASLKNFAGAGTRGTKVVMYSMYFNSMYSMYCMTFKRKKWPKSRAKFHIYLLHTYKPLKNQLLAEIFCLGR